MEVLLWISYIFIGFIFLQFYFLRKKLNAFSQEIETKFDALIQKVQFAVNAGEAWHKPTEHKPLTVVPDEASALAVSSEIIVDSLAKTPEIVIVAPSAIITDNNPTIIDRCMTWITTGNIALKAGALILLFGVGYLLRYAAQHGFVSIEMRLILNAILGFAFVFTGYRIRQKKAEYALITQGIGIGILYLTAIFAYHVYKCLPADFTFFLLIAVTVVGVALAILQEALYLAVFAFVGAFLAPLLASSGHNDYVFLFSYYAVLDIGIAVIATRYVWPIVNLIGFYFTWVVGTVWGVMSYVENDFWRVEFFLILFFLIYATIGILVAYQQQLIKQKKIINAHFVFGLPLVVMGLQAGLVHKIPYGLAWSAWGLMWFYAISATLFYKHFREKLQMLVESFIGIAILFGTLTIPVALSGQWISTAWSIEGLVLTWLGIRQNSQWMRLFGPTLLMVSAFFLLSYIDEKPTANFWDPIFINVFIFSIAAGVGSYLLKKYSQILEDIAEKTFGIALYICALVSWISCGIYQIKNHIFKPSVFLPDPLAWFFPHSNPAIDGINWFLLATAVMAYYAYRKFDCVYLRNTFIGFIVMTCFPTFILSVYWLTDFNGIYYSFEINPIYAFSATTILLVLFFKLRDDPPIFYDNKIQGCLLFLFFSNIALIGESILRLLISVKSDWFILPWAASLWLTSKVLETKIIPFLKTQLATESRANACIATHQNTTKIVLFYVGLFGVLLYSLVKRGDARPLAYYPLFNPLDLSLLVAMLWQCASLNNINNYASPAYYQCHLRSSAVVAFIVYNSILIRAVIHILNVPYRWSLPELQMTLSIAWTILALALMVFAHYRALRRVWYVGLALIVVVVFKLFTMDLALFGNHLLTKVISFISVGGLLLVIGYFAPLPPQKEDQ